MNGIFRFAFLSLLLAFASVSAWGQAQNVYITPSGAATGNCPAGTSTAPNFTAAQFSSSSNWGNSSGKIGAGTTILLCGNVTAAAGSTGLTFQGSGTSASPITLNFDTSAALSAPYWANYPGGAIVINGRNYITINGQNNGIIQNTANGYGLTYAVPSTGVYIAGASNITLENLTIENFCVVNTGDSSGCGNTTSTWDRSVFVSNSSNVTISGNTIHDTNTAVQVDCTNSSSTNDAVTKNTISRANWGVALTDEASSNGCSNFSASYNDISNFSNWDGGKGHHDPIISYVQPSSGKPTFDDVSIYGNYIHGDMGTQASAMGMFLQENNSSGDATVPADGGTFSNLNIFNNVIINGHSGNMNGNGLIGTSGGHIFNNTLDCNQSADGAIWINQDNDAMIENNVIQNCQLGVYVVSSLTLASSNYNVLFNFTGGNYSYCEVGSGSTCVMITGSQACPKSLDCPTIADWQTATGFDKNSSTSTPNLSSSYQPQSPSSAIGLGANLTSQGIAALNVGAPQYFGAAYSCGTGCVARPASGAWNSGAYDTAGTAVLPPTGLTAVVQ